jgi:hypothetical protein
MTDKYYYRYDDDDESDGDSNEDNDDEDPGSIPPRTPPTILKCDAVLRDPDCPVPKRQRSLNFNLARGPGGGHNGDQVGGIRNIPTGIRNIPFTNHLSFATHSFTLLNDFSFVFADDYKSVNGIAQE